MAEVMLEFAINMELDGQKYYAEQAALHPNDGLKVVFELLAAEEGGHAALLRSKSSGTALRLAEPERPGLDNVFSGAADFKSDIKETPGQLDAYRMALEKERQSIDLYQKLLDQDGADNALYAFLIQQEQEHSDILEEIVKLVNRPGSWVESAEFGLREEY